ncbi:MAG: prepilin-type N-terminal cleavage/methylation domain-containing protein [Calditrichae bacterium]|nr:prepilin-type N-terminal cleavage/methylation domain-containing protein [Calditrichota bacterium]MCB9057307.1 prepilin-type N-terminal cleavage/methylation domain-containing protein [Calditrichia bacterium]
MKYKREEQGFTLIELVVVITIIGIILPSLFVLMGNLSIQSFNSRLTSQVINLANSRMEEIQAFKEESWDWYKDINNYSETENSNGFTRNTTITYHNSWGNSGYEAYEINVNVSHSKLPQGYTLRFFLTKYSK